MRQNRRQFLAAASAFCLASPAYAHSMARVGGAAFGSSWRVVAPPQADEALVRFAVAEVVASTDAAMSPYRRDSEITWFNAGPAGAHDVSEDLSVVAAEALRVAKASGGAFDPATGPLVRHFGFGPIDGTEGAYSSFEAGPSWISKQESGLTLDLCGVAKGYALDQVAAALAQAGIRDALVELGGEVRGLGRRPDGQAWRVGVETPGARTPSLQRILALSDRALATSGLLPNGFDDGKRRLSHIIDPRTRRPVASDLASVTVAADSGMSADAWATALMVLGPEAGPEAAEAQGLDALLLIRDQGRFREIMTGDFAALVVE